MRRSEEAHVPSSAEDVSGEQEAPRGSLQMQRNGGTNFTVEKRTEQAVRLQFTEPTNEVF